jgi:hypothetical protein
MKTLRNDNSLLELAKYLGEPLPVTNMNIPCVLDQQLLPQYHIT